MNQPIDKLEKRKKKERILFLGGPLLAGLSALCAFAGVDFPAWTIVLIFVVGAPITVYYVHVAHKRFFNNDDKIK